MELEVVAKISIRRKTGKQKRSSIGQRFGIMHMTLSDTTHLLRRILELGFVLWANVVFRGVVLGGTLLFCRHFFEPLLLQHLEGIAKLDIADWLYFVVGIATVVLWSGIRGKPLLRDANREQFEAMEYVVR